MVIARKYQLTADFGVFVFLCYAGFLSALKFGIQLLVSLRDVGYSLKKFDYG